MKYLAYLKWLMVILLLLVLILFLIYFKNNNQKTVAIPDLIKVVNFFPPIGGKHVTTYSQANLAYVLDDGHVTIIKNKEPIAALKLNYSYSPLIETDETEG